MRFSPMAFARGRYAINFADRKIVFASRKRDTFNAGLNLRMGHAKRGRKLKRTRKKIRIRVWVRAYSYSTFNVWFILLRREINILETYSSLRYASRAR